MFDFIKENKMIIGVVALIVLVVSIVVMAVVVEANEPVAGEIYKLVYHPAHTTMVPHYNHIPNGNGGSTTITTYIPVHHPEKWEVKYRIFDNDKEKWLRGNCFVDQTTFHTLNVGDWFENPEKGNK